MSKLITFAGVSRVAGELKFRGANDVKRIDQLRKLGDADVELRFLSKASTKQEAAQELLAMDFANGRSDVLALLTAVANEEVKVARVAKPKTVKVKAKKAKVATPSVFDTKMSSKEAEKVRAEFMKKLKAAYEAA
jgi:hypothetical protein